MQPGKRVGWASPGDRAAASQCSDWVYTECTLAGVASFCSDLERVLGADAWCCLVVVPVGLALTRRSGRSLTFDAAHAAAQPHWAAL